MCKRSDPCPLKRDKDECKEVACLYYPNIKAFFYRLFTFEQRKKRWWEE